jgi:hypothetical protein
MAGTQLGFSDIYGPGNSKARVVGVASRIKVVDDIARAPKGLGDYRYLCGILYSLLQSLRRTCNDTMLLRPSEG